MGRIKKTATERHTATLSPDIESFVKDATETPLHQLPQKLDTFPHSWPFPRGDLYHWIPLLDRFDHVLELFNKEYGLDEGPQTQPFERRLLQKGDAEEGMSYPAAGAELQELESLGYSEDGDRELVESVVQFTRVLLEHCGNRSLYASSAQLNNLLHTTSLSLLRSCLKLALRLAQRYQVARSKNGYAHAGALLLANHYAFNLDNLHKLALPFPKPSTSSTGAVALTATPGKGKEKASPVQAFNPSDLVTIAKEPQTLAAKGDLANVSITFYDQAGPSSRPSTAQQATEASPSTPTPVRRTSNLGPSRDRPSTGDRSASSSEVVSTPGKSRDTETAVSSAPKVYSISSAKVASTPAWALLREALPNIPTELRYDLLNRIRVAKALTTPEESMQQLLEIRLLSIANLAYALGESKFHEKIGVPDSEEPRRFHLAQQLCDLLQPATNGQKPLSLETETTVLLAIEALAKSRHKLAEVADALAITVNHGVLYYELRKVIATLNLEEHADKRLELQETEWRETTFELVNSLQQSSSQARYGERMVAAGIMGILIEALSLQTKRAERFHEKILNFFSSFVHNIPTAFQTLANLKGLNVLADLTQQQVDTALDAVASGNGLPQRYKSKVVDYSIPFYQQSTLRQLFKFTVHMYEHNAGTHDRLLRNFIDTPQILGALKKVIENASVFGSNVWSGAVNIMSSFIHNEPTSYQVVGEAGLTKSLLESITQETLPDVLPDVENFDLTETDMPSNVPFEDGEPQFPSVPGILPVSETMQDIPGAFGAICLNENGMKLFQASRALVKFFDIFVSPAHVKVLEDESNSAESIGHAFDELSRHHPPLKDQIMTAVVAMVRRVADLSNNIAYYNSVGAKLWLMTPDGTRSIAGGQAAMASPKADYCNRIREEGGDFAPFYDTAEIRAQDVNEGIAERATALPYISACIKFLHGFFHNSSMTAYFCERGGTEHVMDLITSPSHPHDISAFQIHNKFSKVLKMMCDAKAHLVLPSIIRRTQNALMGVKPIVDSSRREGAFAKYVNFADSSLENQFSRGLDGTTVLKELAKSSTLINILGSVFAPPQYTSRHSSQTNQLFTTLNFTDVYIQLVDELSKLHAACLWENLSLLESVSSEFKDKTDPKAYMMRRNDVNGYVVLAAESRSVEESGESQATNNGTKSAELTDEQFAIKNTKAIRFVLNQAPQSIETFFHSLAQGLFPKRTQDVAVKQHASMVAEHLARNMLWEIDYRKYGDVDEVMELKYISQSLHAYNKAMLKSSFSMDGFGPKEALTLVLHKFYLNGGFSKLNAYLDRLGTVLSEQQVKDDGGAQAARSALRWILEFYTHVVRFKTITDAFQSNVISVREHRQGDYFMPGQFVVEIRDAVLPAVSSLWNSPAIEKVGDQYVKQIIDILRVILKGEGEDRALKRSDNASRRVQTHKLKFALTNTNGVATLTNEGVETRLAREAVYRCNNHQASAQEYARLRPPYPSFPIPEEAAAPAADSAATAPESSRAPQRQRSVDMTDAEEGDSAADTAEPSVGTSDVPVLESDMMSDDDDTPGAIGALPGDLGEQDLMAMIGGSNRLHDILSLTNGGSVGRSADPPAEDTKQPFTTVEDLDEKRKALRNALIDRCLEVLSAVPGTTFELADLIQAAVAKSGEGANPRADIGRTLVSSLLSLQISEDEPSEESGVKISAYAHLVALILQDRDFFDSTLDELKAYFDNLVSWVELGGDQKAEDAPWMEMILLIIERVLSEDEQPAHITWEPPPADDPLKPLPVPEAEEPAVPEDVRSRLFDAMIDVLPKIGKNVSLALSVSRVLVTLTRRRNLALRLSEKQCMSRLFLMMRQLAGAVDEKLRSSFMLILRHMIEDEQMIRQIMQTEIRAAFEGHRSSRAMDTSTYTRNLYHLILRDPKIFVDVTKDMLEIARYDGHPTRGQSLALKKEKPSTSAGQNGEQVEAKPDAQLSVEAGSADTQKPAESKPPVAESADGVVAFLLRELSNYKDVEDRPPVSSKESQPATAETNGSASRDVEMTDENTPAPSSNGATPAPTPAADASKLGKTPFKAEEHSIYIYRCFILQCLAELLACYNRTKVEFINFSRKPETQPATPSKPRAGTLNYLLNVLIPVGTLEHKDDIVHRKKISTSNWATTVLVSLCAKTTEKGLRNPRREETSPEEDADLTFVRRFVLEHALRSFKEATVSTEPLDQRYSRLLGLGELFNRMLNNKADRTGASASDGSTSQQIGRLMYEKNFIGALTSSIAELDLNFPNAKRAVKYILGPLKQLTELGVTLSESSDLSSSAPGTSTEDEEISSATSVSGDEDEEREQTPDLLRNTTLGMLESGAHDEDDESGSDDEEDEDMYDDGYDEEMEYEEEVPEHGDVVSDEDEEIEGMGDVEGVPGDVDMDVEIVMGDEEEIDDEDDDDDDEDDEDDDEDDEGDEDAEFADHIDEITGDDENASLADEDDEGDWEEDDGVDFEDQADHGGSPHGGPLDHIAHVIGADEHSDTGEQDGIVRIDMGDGEEEFFEDEMPPEDEDDEDEEADYENDVVYEPELEEDDDEDQEMGFGWDAPPPPVLVRGHHHHPPHHHHHPRGFNEMFGMLGGGGGDAFRPPAFRSHRTASTGRGEDDGLNPLLRREGSRNDNRDREGIMAAPFGRLTRRNWGLPAQADGFIQDLVAAVNPAGGAGSINVSIGGMDRFAGAVPHVFQIQGRPGAQMLDFDPGRPWRDQLFPRFAAEFGFPGGRGADGRATANSDEAQAVEFHVTPTMARWQEEARMLFGGKHHEKATRIITALLRALVPPAMEAKNQHDKAEKKRREEEEKAREEERKKVEAEKAEREARERQEREERQAKEREEAARREQEEREARAAPGNEASGMEGVVQSQENATAEDAPTEPPQTEETTERITTTIRGREVDITTLGIDREYLEALPEDMREEVIMSQFQVQRTAAAQAGEQPSEISREFLDALPREIQQELLRSEAHERRLRERDEARRRAAQEGGGAQPAQPEEPSNADFMAMLDPALRQELLMDSDENTLAALPEDLQAEARALLGDRLPRVGGLGGIRRVGDGNGIRVVNATGERADQAAREASRQHRPVIQMLDKAGIATLLRLMFVSLHHKAKANLHNVLSDVCKNIQNRADVISNLLTILQDGTADMAAVERSFAQLSLRARQGAAQKTPQPLKRTPTGLSSTPMADLSPLHIVQQCLSTLSALSADNQKVPTFFLTEHEIGSIAGQKAKAAKKGKGKESKAAKYPLNALLTLLDRKLITDNTGVMETLAALLSRVTHPLTMLLRRAREAQTTEPAEGDKPSEEQAHADVAMGEASTTDAATEASALANSGEQKPEDEADKDVTKADDKKHRMPTPPEVPEENIRLVVNILAARECPSKTFSDTLDIIKNLSAIPGAKEVFGRELVRQAQGLGQSVLVDLQELATQINAAQTGTDLQGLALANFSSAGSKQRKLLRVLLALDHLFDPKRMPQSQAALSATDPKLKGDVLALLYESETFESLWSNLTTCLAAIRRRGNMVNVATILLPLIESLMVVCRNSTVKEAQTATTPVDTSVTSPPPESRMEGLFFRFTEENRKILNELIRNNPKLMGGNLSILAKNSKVLEFDNKRTYFNRKLHNRGEVRVPHSSLQLSVRRDQVFLDSFKSLYYKSGDEIKYGKLNIRFHGEEGIDAGGVSREWFAAMARQMFNPDYALFNPVASDRTTFHPNPLSEINNEHLLFFKFIGRIIGKALYEGRVLDCHFSRAVYRRILGKSVALKDMESLDLDYYKSLDWILHNDITDVTFETFSIDLDRFGVTETVDLIENGRNIPVTEENKQKYVQLVVEFRLIKSVENQLEKFLEGFHEIIPRELVSIFNEQELELLISGLPEIDVDDWKNNTEYHNYQPTSPQIQWFWRAVRSFDKEEKAKLLQFVTGTSKVPLNGFKELEGMNGFAKFNIHRDYSSKEKLPSSHTCFNQLDLPEYDSYEHLRHQLYIAITAGGEYFGFA